MPEAFGLCALLSHATARAVNQTIDGSSPGTKNAGKGHILGM